MKLAVNETKSIQFNNLPYTILRKSKWTYQVLTTTGDLICSDKSVPKVMEKATDKISLMYEKTNVKLEKTVEKNPLASKIKKKVRKTQTPVDQPKVKKVSIKSITFDLIIKGEDDQPIIDAVKEVHPDSKFDQSHVSWYRSTLYRDGIIGPEHAPRRTTAYKDWKKQQSND